MTFANPKLLWLLLVIPPALLVFLVWAQRARRRLMMQFIRARLLPGLVAGVSPARRNLRSALLVAAVVFLVLALARPQWGYRLQEARQRGLDIVVAIDTSKSMLARDIAPDRLTRAKLAALDLMQQAKSDRLGLVAFAGDAFLECPLTIDDAAFRQSVEALDVTTLPVGGTAIASAIQEAAQAFKQADSYKVLVLLTDGEDNASDALEAARKAATRGLHIFTIGIGTTQGDLIRYQGDYVRDAHGNVVKSHLNENLLRQIAGAAKGFYLPLRGADTMETLYRQGLAPLPKSESTEKWVRQPRERYGWPLAAAMVLLALEMLVPERRRSQRSVGGSGTNPREMSGSPGKVKPTEAGAKIPAAALLLALVLLPAAARASATSAAEAMREYKAGNFTNALTVYEALIQKSPADPRLQFNAGAAAYRATNYDAAIQHFTAVLAMPDLKLQEAAYFNLGNTQYRMGEQAKSLDDLQQSWEAAIKSYQNALALDKTDADAAHNLAFVKANVALIIQLREAARRAKEAADEDVRRSNYHQALEIMDSLLQKNPAAKQFQEYTKRLKNIDAIATPSR